MGTIAIYDCGCVVSRPTDQNCKSYGTRWRVYTTAIHVIMKCRDCGKMHHFELRRPGMQVGFYGPKEDIEQVKEEIKSEERTWLSKKNKQLKSLE
jgi:hypothetical protein